MEQGVGHTSTALPNNIAGDGSATTGGVAAPPAKWPPRSSAAAKAYSGLRGYRRPSSASTDAAAAERPVALSSVTNP